MRRLHPDGPLVFHLKALGQKAELPDTTNEAALPQNRKPWKAWEVLERCYRDPEGTA
jgi:hypothetical protein